MEYIILILIVACFAAILWWTFKSAEKNQAAHQAEVVTALKSLVQIQGSGTKETENTDYSPTTMVNLYQKNINSHTALFKLNPEQCYFLPFMDELPLTGVFSHFEDPRVIERVVGSLQGKQIIEGILEDGRKSWMQINWICLHPEEFTNSKNKVERNINNKNVVRIITKIFLIYPGEYEGTSKFEVLNSLTAQCKAVRKIEKQKHRATLYDVVSPYQGRYTLKAQNFELAPQIKEEHTDKFYEPGQFMLGSEAYSVQLSKLVPLVTGWLLKKSAVSVAFYGSAGTGKTRLMDHLAYVLGQDPSVRLINCDEKLLEVMQDLNFKNQILSIFNPEFRNILIFDQIDGVIKSLKMREIFLRLLDSQLTRELNLGLLGTFNGNPMDYSEGIFRYGRCLPIELVPLEGTKSKMKDLILAISEIPEVTGEFQSEIFNTTVNDSNANTPAGKITLGEVFSCFQPNLLKMQEEMQGELAKELEPTVKMGANIELEVSNKTLTRQQKKTRRGRGRKKK